MKRVIAHTRTWSRPRRPAHSVTADDGQHYYVKPRTATNCFAKVLGSRIAAFCGVASVDTAQVVFDDEFVRKARAECKTQEERETLTADVHFGSLYPGDPLTTPIYDLFPVRLADKIRNLPDFSIMRTVDAWVANSVPGHAIFVRQPEKDFRAHFVGFGQSFSFDEQPYFKSWNREFAPLFSPWSWTIAVNALDIVRSITRVDLELMIGDLPSDWCAGACGATVIDQLLARQSTLGKLLMEMRREESGLPARKLVHLETALAPYALSLLA